MPPISTPPAAPKPPRAASLLAFSVLLAACPEPDPPTPRVTVAPAAVTLGPGETQAFVATVADADPPPPLEWRVEGVVGGDPGVGTVDANGVYRAPLSLSGLEGVTLTVHLADDLDAFAAAAITFDASTPSLSIATPDQVVPVGAQRAFLAGSVGLDPSLLRWSLATDPPRNDVGTIDPLSGLYRAPATMPDPSVDRIDVIVTLPGQSFEARTTVTIQELWFDPPEVELLDPGAQATFDLHEDLSTGVTRSVLTAASIDWALENPDPPVASVTGGTVTALDPVGQAKLIATDRDTGAVAGLIIGNAGRPSLHVDEARLVHGVPGFARPAVAELRVARTGLADQGVDVAGEPGLVWEALGDHAAVVAPGDPIPALDDLVAYLDLATRRFVFGHHGGTAPFRLSWPALGISTEFVVELSPTWLVGWGRAPIGQALILETGVIPAGGDAPFTGHDVSVARDHLGRDWQDLLVMLYGVAQPDDPRWSFWRTADLGTAHTLRWDLVEGHGYFVGPELAGLTPNGYTVGDLATGVYADGPLAGRPWATRGLGADLLDEYLTRSYGDGATWEGQRGAFVRFVATAPGPVVIEARLEGSDFEPLRWSFDAKPPHYTGVPRNDYGIHVGTSVYVQLQLTRDPSLPQVAVTPGVEPFPPFRVEVRQPSGELLPEDQWAFYARDQVVDRAVFYLSAPGEWATRLVFQPARGGEAFTTPWAPFEVGSLDDVRASISEGAFALRMISQSPTPFEPGGTQVTFAALTHTGDHPISIETTTGGGSFVIGPGAEIHPGFHELSPLAAAAPFQTAGLFGRWQPVGPYHFVPWTEGGTLETTRGTLYPAVGASTLTLQLVLDPATAWNPLAIPPLVAQTQGGLGRAVFFDPPYVSASVNNCLTPLSGSAGGALTGTWQTVVELRGNQRFAAVRDGVVAADVSVVDAPWFTATAVTPVGDRALRVALDVATAQTTRAALFDGDAHRIRVSADGQTFEAPFRLYRVWLSGWQPDRAADQQTDDDPLVGLPLNARFTGWRDASMPAEVHVDGDARQATLQYGVDSGSGRVVAAVQRRDTASDDDRVIDHDVLRGDAGTLVVGAVPGAPARQAVVIYGSVHDSVDNASGELAPDGYPDDVSDAPGDESLWLRCDGRVADARPFTAFNFVTRPVAALRGPDARLRERTPTGHAAYLDENTFLGAASADPELEIDLDVDAALPGHLDLAGLAHHPDGVGHAEAFDGPRLDAARADAAPDWRGGGSGDALPFGVELDGICFDPDLEFLPTGDVAPNAPALFPPDHQPALTADGFLDDEGASSGGWVGQRAAAWGRYWLVAETPGARWPGLDCGYPLRGTRESVAAATDDLERRAVEADEDGVVDLDDPDAQVAAFATDFDDNDGVNSGVRIDGEHFAYAWTTAPEASPGVPILAAELTGTLVIGERQRFRPVQPGEPGYHPDGTCTEGVDDDLVVTARRYAGGSAAAQIVARKVAVDTLVGALMGIAFATAVPAAVGSTLLYTAGQGGIALVTSFVSESFSLDTGSSAVVGKLNSKAASSTAARATRWGARATRVLGSNAGLVDDAVAVGTRGATEPRWIKWADEGFSIAGLVVSELIKHYALSDGGAEVYGAANAFVSESLSVHIPEQAVAAGDDGLRVATLQAMRSLSIDARTDWRREPPGDVLPVPARGGETHGYIQRCASASQSLMLVLTPRGELQPGQEGAAPKTLADFRVVVDGDDGEVWGLARTAVAVVERQ